jgi:predicted GNAT family acetyltransferase
VILFVGHGNTAANKVYGRVGFVSANDWLEVGFDRDLVDLGHW